MKFSTSLKQLLLRPFLYLLIALHLVQVGTVAASAKLLSGAQTLAGGHIALTALGTGTNGSIDQRGGTLAAQGQTRIVSSASVDNSAAGYIGGQGVSLSAQGALTNTGNGLIEAAQDLTISAQSLDNIRSGAGSVLCCPVLLRSVFISSGSVKSRSTAVANPATPALSLTLTQNLTNTSGFIGSKGATSIAAAAIDNASGTLYGLGDLIVQASAGVSNASGLIRSDANLQLTAQGALDNSAGRLEANGTLQASASQITNAQSGAVVAVGNLTLTATTAGISNATGRISTQANLQLTAPGALDNSGGRLEATGTLTASASQISNTAAGVILAGSTVTLTASAGTLDNHVGTLIAGGKATVTTSQSFRHQSGDVLRGDGGLSLSSGGDLMVDAGTRLESIGDVDLTASGAVNNAGTLHSNTRLGLNGGSFSNSGTLASDGSVTGTLTGAGANSGTFGSGAAFSLTAASFTNTAAGSFSAANDLTVNLTGALLNQGTLSANNLILTAASLDNQGAVAAMNDLTATVSGQFINRSNRLIYAGRDQFLYADTLTNEPDGTLWAGRNLTIQKNAAGARALSVTNDKGVIEAQNDITIRADSFTNQGDTPALTSVSFSDSVPYLVQYGLVGRSPVTTNAAGEPVYYSPWGFRLATFGEVAAFFDRNPGASRTLSWNGATFVSLPDVLNGDPHVQEGGWSVGVNGTQQIVAPGTVVASAKLLAGRDFVFEGGSLANLSSQIAVNRNISLSGSTLINQGQALQRSTTLYAANTLGPFVSATTLENVGGVPSTITAGGSLSGTLSGSLINDSSALPALNTRSAQNSVAVVAALSTTPLANLLQGAAPGAAPAGLTGGVQLVGGQLNTSAVTLPVGSHGQFVAAAPTANYLIETNPLFANRSSFLSSDYFLNRLGIDPAATQKRLGDGNYEQALVRDQIFALTGRRYLGPQLTAPAQYQALMDASVSAKQALNLTLGQPLTATQQDALASDIVWLVEKDVAGQRVLVPQVFLAQASRINLSPDGALIAANDIDLTADNISNSGRIAGEDSLKLAAKDITNRGVLETTAADGTTQVAASRDLLNDGGTIAGGDVTASAGRDLINRAFSFDASADATRGLSTVGRGSVQSTEIGAAGRILAANNATLSAGRDLSFKGGQLAAGGEATLTAGNNLNLGTAQKTTQVSTQVDRGGFASSSTEEGGSQLVTGKALSLTAGNNLTVTGSQAQAGTTLAASAGGELKVIAAKDKDSSRFAFSSGEGGSSGSSNRETVKGSSLAAGSDITLAAGVSREADLTVKASNITSTAGAATLAASGNVSLGTETENRSEQTTTTGSSSGFLSSRSSSSSEASASRTAIGSQVSAERVSIVAGKNLTVTGSQVVGTNDVTLAAQGKLMLDTAQSSRSTSRTETRSESGLFSGGGIGITYGTQSTTQGTQGGGVWNTGSTVGSLTGDINLLSGQGYRQLGSQVLAPTGNINITAPTIEIGAVADTVENKQTFQSQQSGLTLAFSNPVVSALQSVESLAKASTQTTDPRMQALGAASAALTGKKGLESLTTNGAIDPSAATSVGIILSAGSSKNESESTQTSSTAQGSIVAAGQDLTIRATAGDLTVVGSDITAARDITLAARDKITLLAGQSTANSQSSNSGESNKVGIGFTVGQKSGFTLELGASRAKGNADGTDVSFRNTNVTAGNLLGLTSGSDTTLAGATATAAQVIASIGGNLNIQSLQDTSLYASQQNSFGFGASLCIPPFCYGASTFSASVSGSQANGDFASVMRQSGIKAGDGGFQVNVAGNTDLKGAVIASTDKAVTDNLNRLTTGTLTTSDIANRDSSSASSFSFSGSVSGKLGDQSSATTKQEIAAANAPTPKPTGAAGAQEKSGSQSSTTSSAISGGAIAITNEAGQQALTGQDAATTVASLKRDVTSDTAQTNALTKTWTASSLQQEIQQQQANVQIVAAFGSLASKEIGKFAGEQTKPYEQAVLKAQAAETTLNDASASQQAKDAAQQAKAEAQATITQEQGTYDAWKEGGAARVALHTAVGGLSGGLNGALGAGASALAAPELTRLIDGLDAPAAVKQALGAAAASAIGAGAGGTTGAAAAFNQDLNNRQLHATEQQRIKTLAKDLAASDTRRNPKDTNGNSTLSAEQRGLVETYWTNQLTAEALARVDDKMGASRNLFLDEVKSFETSKPGQVADYLKDAATARQAIASAAGEVLTGTTGKPIVADGDVLRAFESTAAQAADTKLFQARDTATLIKQFGSLEAANEAKAQQSGLGNFIMGPSLFGEKTAVLDYLKRPADAIAPSTADIDLALVVGGAGKVAVKAVVKGMVEKALAGTALARAEARQLEIAQLFSISEAKSGVQIGNRTLIELPNSGNAKIFAGATESEVKQFFLDLTGSGKLPEPIAISTKTGPGIRYTITTPQGNFTLRDAASSADVSGPVWTIEIPRGVAKAKDRAEIKFLK